MACSWLHHYSAAIFAFSCQMHMKFDLKGSTFKRKASKAEKAKSSPTFKDLDMLTDIPNGLNLEPDIHSLLMKTMSRDCLVR